MVRKRNPEQTRQRILQAATREFVEKGLTGARVDEIAAASGTNKRMIYHYFGDKDRLYAEVIREVLVDLTRKLPPVPKDDPVAAVRILGEGYFDYCAAHPEYVAIMLWEAVSGWRTKNQVVPDELDPWPAVTVKTIEKGIEAGVFRRDLDPLMAVTAAVSQIFFYFPLASRLKDSWPGIQDRSAARTGIIDLMLHSLLV